MEGFRVFIVSVRKQAQDFIRYPNYLLKSFFYTPVSYILPMYFLMKACVTGESQSSVFDILLCVVVWQYMEFSVVETCNIANRELNIGTVDMIYTLPIPRGALILGSSCMASMLFAVSNMLLICICGILLKTKFTMSVFSAVILFVTVFIQTCVCCVIVFILNLRYKKIFNTVLLVLNVIYILSGVIYPISELPQILRIGSMLLPFTCIFKVIRGENIVACEWILFVIVNVIYFIASVILFLKIEKGMKRDGCLSNY